ncbi:methylated-DNA--[protein]-cysteine S-methyltransferase [Akkermansiaceae bacterium]|nr:methylated-DNA--[protein]-cysteine S-methyltransferase [Akkermansiaceae bacterium]
MSEIHCTRIPSPIGTLTLVASEKGLCGLYMGTHGKVPANSTTWKDDPSRFTSAIDQLAGYFNGKLKAFDLPLDLQGTAFQLRAWHALLGIPYGETLSYGGQAALIGRPKAVRAIGLANGKNPVSIIVPCHRVIGKNGSLTGYGGGLERKRFLLELEAKVKKRMPSADCFPAH